MCGHGTTRILTYSLDEMSTRPSAVSARTRIALSYAFLFHVIFVSNLSVVVVAFVVFVIVVVVIVVIFTVVVVIIHI